MTHTGPNNVTRLHKQNTSYKTPWIQIYDNTVLDSWFVGDYSSASYHITVEFDSNQKETMQVLVVARPDHASYTVFGRTCIQDELITLTATVTASILTLTANPADPNFAGAKVIFNALYAETITPLALPTVVLPSSSGTAGMPTPSELFGTFGTINVTNQPSITASYELDTLTLSSGNGVSITTDANSKTVNISALFPTASQTELGGVKVDGTTIEIDPLTGVISGAITYVLPTASTTVLGGVKVDGNTIIIDNGIISVGSSITNGLSIGTTLTIPTGNTESRPTATQGNLRFNTSLGKFEGYYGSAWGAVGGGLSPTVVQTANGYIAKANDLVRCNTTSGAFSITLPSAPVDGDIIGVIDTHRKFALNNLTILAAGSKKIEDDTTSLVLDIDGSYIALVYNDVNSNWRILETPLGTGISATTIITSNGYVASVNDLVRCNTTTAAFSVTLPTNPIDGSIVNFVDVASAGSFFTNNLTVLPGSGSTIENDTSLLLDVNGTYVSLVYNASATNWKVLQSPYCLLGNVTTSVTLSGLTLGTGNDLTNAVAGTHYQAPIGTISGLVKGNGANALTAATAGTDYQNPIGTISGLVKGNGANALTAATAGTDYQNPIGTISGLVKGNGANALTAATAGTDYQAPIGTISGLVKGNGANALTAATAGVDYMPAVTWVIKDTTYNPAIAGDHILANTSGGAFTIYLPVSPAAGNTIVIADYAGTFATSNLTIASNGNKILGTIQDLVLNVSNRNATLVYTDSTRGWIILF